MQLVEEKGKLCREKERDRMRERKKKGKAEPRAYNTRNNKLHIYELTLKTDLPFRPPYEGARGGTKATSLPLVFRP